MVSWNKAVLIPTFTLSVVFQFIIYCHTWLHLGFLAKLRILQVPACKMEPQSGIISWKNHPPSHPPSQCLNGKFSFLLSHPLFWNDKQLKIWNCKYLKLQYTFLKLYKKIVYHESVENFLKDQNDKSVRAHTIENLFQHNLISEYFSFDFVLEWAGIFFSFWGPKFIQSLSFHCWTYVKSNISLLLCLEPFKKLLVGGWWWWTVNIVFSFRPRFDLKTRVLPKLDKTWH